MTPAEVYADGGVVMVNPSPHGGTWAWCHVAGERAVAEGSGAFPPSAYGMATVSNNLTEFAALLFCLEALPDGWAGRVFTDSGVTLMRFQAPDAVKMNGIPDDLVARLRAVRGRLGELAFVLLGGHPTRKELAAGRRKDGKPVSRWNVWCDHQCGRRGAESLAAPSFAGASR